MHPEWPSEILLRCTHKGEVVSAVLVFVSLLAERKNDYPIPPCLTNDHGQVSLTPSVLEEAITTANWDFPMDYAGTLNDCRGLKIVVEGRHELAARVSRLREFYPADADELERQVLRSSNGLLLRFEREVLVPFAADDIQIELSVQ